MSITEPTPDFERFNDYKAQHDLLGGVSAACREAALRFLVANFEDGQYPYVHSVVEGHAYIVGDGGDCLITPEGELEYGSYVDDAGKLVLRAR